MANYSKHDFDLYDFDYDDSAYLDPQEQEVIRDLTILVGVMPREGGSVAARRAAMHDIRTAEAEEAKPAKEARKAVKAAEKAVKAAERAFKAAERAHKKADQLRERQLSLKSKIKELEAQESALRANGGSDEHFASAQRGLEAAISSLEHAKEVARIFGEHEEV